MSRLSAGQPKNCGAISGRFMGIFLLQCPDGLWGPLSLLFNGYRAFCPAGEREREGGGDKGAGP